MGSSITHRKLIQLNFIALILWLWAYCQTDVVQGVSMLRKSATQQRIIHTATGSRLIPNQKRQKEQRMQNSKPKRKQTDSTNTKRKLHSLRFRERLWVPTSTN